ARSRPAKDSRRRRAASARCRVARLLPVPICWPRPNRASLRAQLSCRAARWLGRQILNPRIYAGEQVGLLNRNLLFLDLGQRRHDLHRVRPRYMRRDLRQVEYDAGGVNRVGIGLWRVLGPVRNVAIGEALDALQCQALLYSLQILD